MEVELKLNIQNLAFEKSPSLMINLFDALYLKASSLSEILTKKIHLQKFINQYKISV